jgi:quercetin dioxygenase-like cupin family protein
MASHGQTIEHPQTGERLTFGRTAAETGGRLTELELVVRPGGGPAAAHLHPVQVETFLVHAGTMELEVGGERRELRAGDIARVEPGTPHTWRAAGADELAVTVTFEPALTAEGFFEDFFALAAAGRTRPDGNARLLDAAVILDDHRDVLYVLRPPVAVQKALFRLLAPVGRALGFGAPRAAARPAVGAA